MFSAHACALLQILADTIPKTSLALTSSKTVAKFIKVIKPRLLSGLMLRKSLIPSGKVLKSILAEKMKLIFITKESNLTV